VASFAVLQFKGAPRRQQNDELYMFAFKEGRFSILARLRAGLNHPRSSGCEVVSKPVARWLRVAFVSVSKNWWLLQIGEYVKWIVFDLSFNINVQFTRAKGTTGFTIRVPADCVMVVVDLLWPAS
jgi:hypothetical protein